MKRWRLGALAFCVILAAVACGEPRKAFGPVQNEEQARVAALFLSGLQPPVTVVGEVTHGISGELYRGPRGMCSGEEACRAAEARRHRLAWKVYLRGMEHGSDCEEAICPLVPMNQILIIDEIEGVVLYGVSSEGDLEGL